MWLQKAEWGAKENDGRRGVSERERETHRERQRSRSKKKNSALYSISLHLSLLLAVLSDVESVPKVASDDHPASEQRHGAEEALLRFCVGGRENGRR